MEVEQTQGAAALPKETNAAGMASQLFFLSFFLSFLSYLFLLYSETVYPSQ